MMVDLHSFRRQARATWSAGGWDHFARLISPVGGVVIDRVGAAPGVRLLDVGTGSAGNLAIPAAQLGAEVVGLDITHQSFSNARPDVPTSPALTSSGSSAMPRSCRLRAPASIA